MISGPDLFEEYDFYVATASEENRAGIKEVDIIWKEATFGQVVKEPDFRNHRLKTVKNENGETVYWLTATSSDNCVDIASRLEKTNEGFLLGVPETGKICACLGCADGCTLKIENDRCSCGTYTPSKNNCEKMEMVELED
jgi:hypothetical protein